jgi:hypothetical protein
MGKNEVFFFGILLSGNSFIKGFKSDSQIIKGCGYNTRAGSF